MSKDKSRRISTTLVQDLVRFHPGGADGPICNHCGGVLELEQPSQKNPHRLLGVCQQCEMWEVIQVLEREETAWVTTLPGEFWPGEAPGAMPAAF